jgi:hypothetical protein
MSRVFLALIASLAVAWLIQLMIDHAKKGRKP